MAQSVYDPIPRYTSGVTIAATSGGNLTGSGTLYIWCQLRNRTGCDFLGAGDGSSSSNTIAYTAGQKITVTVASTVVSGGENPFELIISAAATDTPENAIRIASLWLRASSAVGGTIYSGQGARISLPDTSLELTEDEHINISSLTVANAAALPSGADLINGMVRYQADVTTYYRYDTQQTAWTEYATGTSAYVASLTQAAIAGTQVQGCERQLQNIEAGDQTNFILSPPPYTPDGTLQTAGVIYAIANGFEADSGSDVVQSSQIAFRFFINGINKSSLFSGQVIATLQGYHNMVARTLDTTPDGVGANVVLGTSESSNGVTGLSLPENLGRGYLALYQLQLQVDSTQLAQHIRNNDTITTYPVNEGLLGIPFPAALALGELVLPTSSNMLVVPSTTAKVKMLAGVATVVDSSTNSGYLTRDKGSQDPTGLSNSTPDQRICFSGPLGGDIVVRASVGAVQDWEVTRAVISTKTGTYTGSSYTAATAIAGNTETFRITVTIPSALRNDYPDTQLQGNTQGDFTVPTIIPYVRFGGTIYQLADVAVTAVAGNTQNIDITDLSGATVVGSLPDSSGDPSLSPWGYDTISPSVVPAASSLSAGNYEGAIAWKYDGTTVSKISHSTGDGCIAVAGTSYADLVAASGQSGFTSTIANFTQPAIGANVTVSVASSVWISVGQNLFVENGGYYEVISNPSATTTELQNLGRPGNAAAGATINSGSNVSPAGNAGEFSPAVLTSSSGVLNIDCSLSYSYTFSLTENITSVTVSNLSNSTAFDLEITQTGSFSIASSAWAAGVFAFVGGIKPTITTGSGAKDVFSCKSFDGTVLDVFPATNLIVTS